MNYKAQEHRFIYPGTQGQGHIFSSGTDIGFCGVKKETLKKKAKETDEKLSTVLRFKDGRDLCKRCQNILKASLAEKYGIKDW